MLEIASMYLQHLMQEKKKYSEVMLMKYFSCLFTLSYAATFWKDLDGNVSETWLKLASMDLNLPQQYLTQLDPRLMQPKSKM